MEVSPDIHDDFRGEIVAAAEALAAAYPDVPFAGVQLFEVEGDESLGRVKGDTIEINAHWFARPRAVFDAAVVAGRKATPPGFPAWHGHVGGLEHETERLIAHEFGHLLAAAVSGVDEFAMAGHRTALNDPDLAVSGYALCDADEWFAETFAALRLGGSGSAQVAELAAFIASAKGYTTALPGSLIEDISKRPNGPLA
jgi:hypothetical protein